MLKRFAAVAIDSAVSLQSLRFKPLNQSSDELPAGIAFTASADGHVLDAAGRASCVGPN